VLSDLAGRFATERATEQQIVVREGEPADRFYVVARGKLAVTQALPAGVERNLRMLTDGDYFGEIALLRRVNRTATVRAVVPTVLLSLSREQFAELLRAAPGLTSTLEQTMLNRYRTT
jgi:ATP-binding cassette subfamily B protein